MKANGYVDEEEFEDGEWQHWDYIQKSNRKLDFMKLKDEAKAYLLTELEKKKDETPEPKEYTKIKSRMLRCKEKKLQPGETAVVQLDNREIVAVLMEFLEPREPESEADEDESMQVGEPSEERTIVGALNSRSMTYDAKKAWILNATFRELGDLNSPAGRSGLRAKRHLQSLEVRWWGNQIGKRNVEDPRVFMKMEKHFPFWTALP